MRETNIHARVIKPKVLIKDNESGNIKKTFAPSAGCKSLLNYTFQTGINDTKGSFSLTFYPDDENGNPIFDQISVMDIVEIHERIDPKDENSKPDFIGVVKSRKYVSQVTGSGIQRKLSVSGISVIGLIADYEINLDSKACAITNQMSVTEEIRKKLSIQLIKENLTVKEVIDAVWEHFKHNANAFGCLANPKIGEILEKFCGSIFQVEDGLNVHYYVGNLFNDSGCNNFYGIIDGVTPSPPYEKRIIMDDTGPKIAIRECPFGDSWQNLDDTIQTIDPTYVRAFDFTQSDSDVYTVFFSYVNGYPVQEDKALKLNAIAQNKDGTLEIANKKMGIYGYKPLMVTFNGYGKEDGKQDTTTNEKLQKLNQKLMKWFGQLDEMLTGSLTVITYKKTDSETKEVPKPGEKIKFLGGEWYIETARHTWNYGGSPETVLTISRGGDYSSGEFAPLKNASTAYKLFEEGKKQE